MCASLLADTVRIITVPTPAFPLPYDKAISLAIQVLAAMFLWFFWKGQNWARCLVIIQSVFCLLLVIHSAHKWPTSHVSFAITVYDAVLSVFFLWYLNTRLIRAWFGVEPITG